MGDTAYDPEVFRLIFPQLAVNFVDGISGSPANPSVECGFRKISAWYVPQSKKASLVYNGEWTLEYKLL